MRELRSYELLYLSNFTPSQLKPKSTEKPKPIGDQRNRHIHTLKTIYDKGTVTDELFNIRFEELKTALSGTKIFGDVNDGEIDLFLKYDLELKKVDAELPILGTSIKEKYQVKPQRWIKWAT